MTKSEAKKRCSLLVDEQSAYAEIYRRFKEFLENNYAALDAMAELETAYHGGRVLSVADLHDKLGLLFQSVKSMATSMKILGGERYAALERVVQKLSTEVLAELRPMAESRKELVLPLTGITPEMVTFVGAKATNLGVMAGHLDLPVPPGFVVTAEGFRDYLRGNGLQETLKRLLDELGQDSQDKLNVVSGKLQQVVLQGDVPRELSEEISAAYAALEDRFGKNCPVAVRSSAVGEDGEVSFAGQYVSVLGVDKAGLTQAYQQVVASKYGARALSYRMQHGLTDEETPMAVLVLPMVDALASGVLYSMDPSGANPDELTISAVWGLGEALVGGEQSPDVYRVQKKTVTVLHRDIVRKETMLVLDRQKGTRAVDVPASRRDAPVLGERRIEMLARYGMQLEEYFQSPQDVEWAIDREGRIRILQARPLKVAEQASTERTEIDAARHPVLLSAGKTASPGLAAGQAFVVTSADPGNVPEGSILVARTTSPELARYMSVVLGVITDMGAVGSHLASVAREFGVPAIVDAKEATGRIEQGAEITMDAGTTTVYAGRIQDWLDQAPGFSRRTLSGPTHRRLGAIIKKISPLNLTDPASESFSPDHCQTLHDVIRYLHEKSITEMFSLSEDMRHRPHPTAELATDIPLRIRVIDLGGGLESGLTSCDTVSPDHIRSIPLRALWRGLTHPGLNWSSSVDLNLRNLGGLLAGGGLGEMERRGEQHSYALLARDYLNLNAKFGFHYANLDVLCAETGSGNHVMFQFSGGAGGYYGKSLRVLLLANILQKLDFSTEIKGDFLSASLKGYDAPLVLEKLDQLGRLLACSRLLDVALGQESDVERLTEMFFNGDYDFLAKTDRDAIQGFYVREGHWIRRQEGEEVICRQEGVRIMDPVSTGLACLLGRATGSGYHSFLESIKAYSYFPLAIAKESHFAEGVLKVAAKCESGCIDMAAGLVFGLSNAGNYHVFRIDALKGNVVLLAFSRGKSRELARAEFPLEPGRWYALAVTIHGEDIRASVDGKKILTYQAEEAVQGFCGLWSKADSVVSFKQMLLRDVHGGRFFPF
jgi:pyruvate, water dikinase